MTLRCKKPFRKMRVGAVAAVLGRKLDKLWATYIKTRDGWRCQRCGRSKEAGFKIEAAHIVPRSRSLLLRWDKNNGVALCYACHEIRWHGHSDGLGWFKEKYPDRWALLEPYVHALNTTKGKAELERRQAIADDLKHEILRLGTSFCDTAKSRGLDAAIEFEDRID